MSVRPIAGWLRRGTAVFVAAAVVAGLALWYFTTRLPPIPQRPLRIGFEPNPPMQIRAASGFAGLAVEMVSQAAERAGLQLRWVETGTSSDEAFQKGLVDLWPLMADLPDRRKRIHFIRPWLHSNFSLLLHADSLSLDRNFTGLIAVFRMPLNVRLLREHFLHAQVDEFPEAKDVVKAVCRGQAAAGFLEGRVALTALRDKPSECAPVALRVQTLPDLSLQSSVASTFEAAGGADIIRREIGNMYRDGTLAAAMAKYSYYGLDSTWTSFDLMDAAERTRRRAWGIGALAMGVALALWLASFLYQRQRAEVMLRDSEERFRATFFQAAVGIAQTSLQGGWLLLNNRFSEIVGYAQAELRGKTFVDITHPDDREANIVARRQFLAGEISSWSVEKRYIHKNGATVWARVHVSLVRDQHHVPQYFISVVEDITDRVEAERALRDSEHRLVLAQSAANLGVWERDLRSDTIAISGEYATLYGLPHDRSQLTHQEWLSLVHPDDRERMEALLRENRERPGDWDVEFRVVWPDRSLHWLLGKGTVLFDDFGQPVRRVGVHLDITERKRAEALLRESEQRFRDLADSAPVMIWVIGPDKRATFFNKYCLDFTGQTMDEKLGEGWIKGLHPEDRERFLGVYSSSIDARREFNSIFRVRRADGKYRWVLCTGVPRFAAAGAFSGYIGSCVDIADQKLVEEQLRANEVRLKDAQRLAKVGSWERHIANDSIYWSDEMLQILGLPNAPPVDFSSFLNYVHPRDREIIMEADRKIRSGIASLDVEYRITQPSGSVRFVRSIVEAIRNDQGAVVRIAGATQDVTEEVRARELLRESEKHLKNAERLAHLGHWQWDIWANRVSGSEEMLRILWKPQNYVPSHEQFLQDLVPQDRERVERLIRDSIEKKIGYSTEYQIALPNGELRTISCICEVLLDEEGLPARMFGTCQDVTDQRLAEVSLRQSLDEIAHLNRVAAMGELTASLAHELNQPLAAILSNAQAAIRFVGGQSPDLAQVRECLSDIVADDKRAGEVIKRLRGLLRKGQYQPSLVDLNEVVSEAVRLVGNDALLRQVSVKFEPLPGLPPVLGDRIQLYQVALNLIVNGLDASAEKPPGDRWVLVRTAEADGGRVELTVEDSGKGIAESEISRLFEPFFTTKRDGLGMGLSISRSIVQAHRGQIWAENRAGRGAIFHCVLPVAQQAAVAATL